MNIRSLNLALTFQWTFLPWAAFQTTAAACLGVRWTPNSLTLVAWTGAFMIMGGGLVLRAPMRYSLFGCEAMEPGDQSS